MKKNQKIILIAVIVIIAIALAFFLNSQFNYMGENTNNGSNKASSGELGFMDNTEKEELGIPADQKIQVLERDENGMVTAYRPITSDADIITDDSWKDYASSAPIIEASTSTTIAQ